MTDISQRDRRKELAFFDQNSQRSLANLLPEEMLAQLQRAWDGDLGHLFQLQDHSLVAEMNRAGHAPEALDHILRVRFWLEFNRCQDEDWQRPKLDLALVLGRDMAREKFYRFYIRDHYRLIFMLTPPVQYRQALEHALQLSTARIIEFLEKVRTFDPATCEAKPASIDKVLKIHEMLIARVENVKGSGAGSRKGQGAKAIIPDAAPLPGIPRSVEEQLEDLRERNAELERLRGADIKKETGG